MKVKIGNKIYDSNNEPIMIILDNLDKDNIRSMPPEFYKYSAYPKGMSTSDVFKFMECDKDKER